MSTILKALKKAEEGMARNTLPGKILVADPARPLGVMRIHIRVSTVVLLSLLVVIAGLAYYLRPHERGAVVMKNDSARPALSVTTAAPVREAHGEENAALPPLRLSGVLWDKSKPLAILNGMPLAVGGEVEGAQVVKIGLDGVKVRYRGREHTLTVE